MLKKIYIELVAIRKELQAIKFSLEPHEKQFSVDRDAICQAVQKSTHDTHARYQG